MHYSTFPKSLRGNISQLDEFESLVVGGKRNVREKFYLG